MKYDLFKHMIRACCAFQCVPLTPRRSSSLDAALAGLVSLRSGKGTTPVVSSEPLSQCRALLRCLALQTLLRPSLVPRSDPLVAGDGRKTFLNADVKPGT